MSGFVIAYTYEEKLKSGLSIARFALNRAIRLYPLVVAAVAATAFLRLIYPRPVWPSEKFTYDFIMNLLLLPNSLSSSAERFVFVPPAWSLFHELAVNLLYSVFISFLTRKILVGIAVVTGVALALLTYAHGSVMLLHESIFAGFIRTTFSFSLGVLIFRQLVESARVSSKIPAIILYGVLCIVLLLPAITRSDWLYDLTAIFILFPAMIAIAVRQASDGRRRIESELGEISYPIYVLHMPILAYAGVAFGWIGSGQAIPFAALVLSLVTAALAWRLYDRPVRKWLNSRLHHPDPQHGLRAEP